MSVCCPPGGARSPGVGVVPGGFDRAHARVSGQHLLGRRVRARGIELGRSVDLLLDPSQGRVLALDVLCGDGRNRLLPLAAATIGLDELVLPSALVLIDDEEGAFYRQRTIRLSSLRGVPVERDARTVGHLRDLVLDPEGRIAALLVDDGEGDGAVPWSGALNLGAGLLRC